ncbi:helix-turn-helix domain-containing protein [Mucilaginibacter terrae]|uniref:AraC family transcriptional regulator n=1 Tax=Mucilaginibacter terrae TaxID=1955052 RepID=UPI0036366DF2
MQPVFYIPNPALSGYISHIMIMQARFPAGMEHLVYPFPPTPQHSIHFYPRDALQTQMLNRDFVFTPNCIVVGPQVTKVNLKMGRNHCIVSVVFHPGGLHRLLKMPLYELFDEPYDAAWLLGSGINQVVEQLNAAANTWDMKTIVEQFFLTKAVGEQIAGFDLALKQMVKSEGLLPIELAASLACLSLRQFERRFKESMGYSPKVFSRLIRFSKAYRLKEKQQGLSWTDIAHTCGYFDQMHLIRDFKEFTDAVPGTIALEIKNVPMGLQAGMKF